MSWGGVPKDTNAEGRRRPKAGAGHWHQCFGKRAQRAHNAADLLAGNLVVLEPPGACGTDVIIGDREIAARAR